MKHAKITDFYRGWVVGSFERAIYQTPYEVAVQFYKAGEKCQAHYHKKTSEINIVSKGSCIFIHKLPEYSSKYVLSEGDILIVEPNEIVEFQAKTDCAVTVIKQISDPNDKYLS